MKVTINDYRAVALWRWNLRDASKGAEEEEEEDLDEEVCGICRVPFDGCCPDCKVPGDDCPLIWGECTHVFHMHCLLKWLATASSKSQCPMDRRPWVTAGAVAPPMDQT